jgi:hypothetical protein
MGYAGYAPGHRVPDKASPLGAALKVISSLEALELLSKLTYNCCVSPNEDKFRRIRLSNERISATLSNQGELCHYARLRACFCKLCGASASPPRLLLPSKCMLQAAAGVREALVQLGWVESEAEPDFMTITKGASTMAQVCFWILLIFLSVTALLRIAKDSAVP